VTTPVGGSLSAQRYEHEAQKSRQSVYISPPRRGLLGCPSFAEAVDGRVLLGTGEESRYWNVAPRGSRLRNGRIVGPKKNLIPDSIVRELDQFAEKVCSSPFVPPPIVGVVACWRYSLYRNPYTYSRELAVEYPSYSTCLKNIDWNYYSLYAC